MSKMIYWAAVPINKQKRFKWPLIFHFREKDAKDNASRWNRLYQGTRMGRYHVERFILDFKGDHYDIYKHHYERQDAKS